MQKLYALLSLEEASPNAKSLSLSSICYVDYMPEKVVMALVATLKSNMNGRTELQDLIASLVQRDIERLEEYQHHQ